MSERQPLTKYIPEQQGQNPTIDIQTYLSPVVARLAGILPQEEIWRRYSSEPNATGGRVVFPYRRVDSDITSCRNYLYLVEKHGKDPAKVAEWYAEASTLAFNSVAWVEVGFEGLENLAVSPASVNWTSGVGHTVTNEERAAGIMGEGARMYRGFLSELVDVRNRLGITEDDFTRYGLEDTLYGIKTAKARAELAELGVSARMIEGTIDVLRKVDTYDGLRQEFGERRWTCGEEQFLMPVMQPVYLADAKLRERMAARISEQAGVTPEVANEYMSDMGYDPSLVFALRYGDEVGRDAVEKFVMAAPYIVFDEARNYLGLKRPSAPTSE